MATPIIIAGRLVKLVDDAEIGVDGVVEAVPYLRPARFKDTSDAWIDESYLPRRAKANANGEWSLPLPKPADSKPDGQQYIITMPDGARYMGAVPTSGGPYTIKDLVESNGWTLLNPSDSLQFVAGYATVQDAGTPVAQETTLNFGTGFTVTDDPTNHRTTVDVDSAAEVPSSRTLTAGAGLTGGGSLAANRTFDVVANADGSIVVNANDVQVGVLASDAQHGTRGGGTVHANAVAAGAAGFMTGADKTKLDGITAGAAVSSVGVSAPITTTGGTAPTIGISAASTSVPGSMSAADKTKLDGIEAGAQAVTAAHVQTATAALASAMSVNSQKITNLATPTTGTDAATKAYADSVGGAGAAVMLTAYQPGPVGTFPQDAQFHNQTVGTGWIDPNTGTWSQGEFPSASYFSGGLVAQMVPSGSGGFTLDRMFCSVLTPPAGGETLTIKAKYSTDYGSTWTTSLTATIAAGAHAGNSGATVSSTIPQGAIVSFEVSNNTGTQVAADLVVGVRANLL